MLSIYNTLLKLAQSERPDDPVMSKMSEIGGQVQVGTLRIRVGQIVTALFGLVSLAVSPDPPSSMPT